jgi:hypothetical protein
MFLAQIGFRQLRTQFICVANVMSASFSQIDWLLGKRLAYMAKVKFYVLAQIGSQLGTKFICA